MPEQLYKVLTADLRGPFSHYQWTTSKKVTADGDLVACENGVHLCRRGDLVHWLNVRIFRAHYEGEIIESGNKVVVRTAWLGGEFTTWNECTQRLFAADCAEQVLHIFEAERPGDDRPRKAIEAARQFARGEIDAAAEDAAWDAAWAAAGAAAGAAARAAAWDAAWDAVWTAARDAECEWQSTRLLEYLEEATS